MVFIAHKGLAGNRPGPAIEAPETKIMKPSYKSFLIARGSCIPPTLTFKICHSKHKWLDK